MTMPDALSNDTVREVGTLEKGKEKGKRNKAEESAQRDKPLDGSRSKAPSSK